MVWHILRKDWRLLRWLVLATVTVHAITASAQLGPAGGIPALAITGLLIVLLVHQDPLPGVRQDWLVRPIRRADLLLAKILFVVLVVHLPLAAFDLTMGLSQGFGPSASMAAALSRSVYMLVVFSLPALALAALTRTMTDVAMALAAWFSILLAFSALPALAGWVSAYDRSGLAWVPATTRQVLLLAGALTVLWVQFARRWSAMARGAFLTAVLLGHSTAFMPWGVAAAIQAALSPGEARAADLRLVFDPGIGPYHPAPGQNVDDVEERPGFGPADVDAENQRRRAEGAVTVFLPLRVGRLPGQSSLVADRSDIRLTDQSGVTLFEGTGNALEMRLDADASGDVTTHHGLRIPRDVYNRVGGQRVRLEVDYTLTRFERRDRSRMPALDADLRIPAVGRCSTRLTRSETAVEMRCVTPGEIPSCITAQLRHEASGYRNPEVSLCAPDYRPFPGHLLPDAMSRLRGVLPFADASGVARYPVDGSRLAESVVIVTSFTPREHFARHVIVPEFRLDEWRAVPLAAAPADAAASELP